MSPEPMTDYDPDIAQLVQRAFGAELPARSADEVARLAMSARGSRIVWSWLALATVAAAVLVGVVLYSTTRPPVGSGPTVQLHLSGYTLRYPASWTFYASGLVTPGGVGFEGYIASGESDPGPICREGGGSTSCGFGNLDLQPGQAAVGIATDYGRPMVGEPGPQAGEEVTRVDGMPAFFSSGSDPGGTVTLTWRIRMPGSVDTLLLLSARLRGPRADVLESQVRAAVDTLHWDNPPRELPKDPATVNAAARRALAWLTTRDQGYACFPPPGESRTLVVDRLPGWGDPLSTVQQLPVKCDTSVEETDARLWKLTLQVDWPIPHSTGTIIATVYINVDGEVVSTTVAHTGDAPTGPR
jgi:hypothetical protein